MSVNTSQSIQEANVSLKTNDEEAIRKNSGSQGHVPSEEKRASGTTPQAPIRSSAEEILKRKQTLLDGAKEMWKFFTDESQLKDENGEYTKHFRDVIEKTSSLEYSMNGSPHAAIEAYKRELYTMFVEMQAANSVCDAVSHILKNGIKDTSGEVGDTFQLLSMSFRVLINFTANSIDRTDILMNHLEIMQCFKEALVKLKDDYFSVDKEDECTDRIVSASLSIVHNVAMQNGNVSQLRKMNFVDVLKPYLKSKIAKQKMSCIAALADIIDEEESEIIKADRKAIRFMIDTLNQAMVDEHRRMHGWSTLEIARTLRRIARNDANKRALVWCGVIPLLLKLAVFEDVEEQREAVGTLRTLSFDEDNMDDMISDNECFPVDTIIRLRTSPDKEVRNSCIGALWTMREKLADSKTYTDIGNHYLNFGATVSSERQVNISKGHIMVSYQWDNQTIIRNICENLRGKGYKVWMDIDDMEGSTTDAMAKAVEQADIVLVCFSQRYKDSNNCRAEAEYAFQKKKKIIPIKMEGHYDADGWLGLIIGTKLFFDFSGRYTFDSRMNILMKELKPKRRSLVMSEKASSETASRWTRDQVTAWLRKHDIPVERFSSLTGVEVAFLQLLVVECPDYFYKTITEKMQVQDLPTLSKLRLALNDTSL